MKSNFKSYLKVITAMLIWGSLAIFVRRVSISSAEIVLCRVILGTLFLGAIFLLKKQKPDREKLKKYGLRLLLTGAVMGFNWVALFEAYRYVDVSVATLCYYCAPVIVMFVSVFLFKENLGAVKLLSMAAAVGGMIIVTGVSMGGTEPVKGVIFGLISAALYSCVTLSNKTVKGMGGLEITIVQLLGAGIVMIPYVLITHEGAWSMPSGQEICCLLVLGFVHTGIALYLYFAAIQELPAQSIALMSYIDPMSALIFAAIFLNDALTPVQLIGAVMILGGAVAGELFGNKRRKAENASIASEPQPQNVKQ